MKLVWDAEGKRFYEAGVSNGVLYKKSAQGDAMVGVAWNGLISVTESPSGAEITDLYADNIKYASMRSAETFGATIEAYTYPDEFAECDGSAEPVNGLFLGQQPRKTFGFSYRSAVGSDTSDITDGAYKLHLIYNATASPSEKAYSTINDSPDAITFSWEIVTTPIAVTGYKPTASLTIDSTKANTAKLTALEAILYGSADTAARLPMPDEVIELLTATT
jgi:hypothetical protein